MHAWQNHTVFTPHIFISDGVDGNCHGDDGQSRCTNSCTNAGRYCAVLEHNSATGTEVATEALRLLCVWNLYGQDNGVGREWWDYVKIFNELCDPGHSSSTGGLSFSDEKCVAKAMDQARVDKDKVDNCMEVSGGTKEDKPNTLLTKELNDQRSTTIHRLPSLSVNHVVVIEDNFSFRFDTAFKAICDGFPTGSDPPVCQECVSCSDIKTCVDHLHCEYPQNKGSRSIAASHENVTLSSILVVLCIVLLFFERF